MGAFRHETALMAAAIREFGFRSTVWGFGGRAVQEFWVRSFSLRQNPENVYPKLFKAF